MQPLTEHQRDMLVAHVARSLCWSAAMTVDRETYLWRAKIVVRDLEALGVSGASLKRAVERVLLVPADQEAASA